MNHSWISCRYANSIILNYSSVYFSKARTLSCMIIVQSSKSLFYISISSTDSFAFNQLTQRCHFFLSSLGYNSVSYVAFNTQVSIGSLDLNWFFKFSSLSIRTLSGKSAGFSFCGVVHSGSVCSLLMTRLRPCILGRNLVETMPCTEKLSAVLPLEMLAFITWFHTIKFPLSLHNWWRFCEEATLIFCPHQSVSTDECLMNQRPRWWLSSQLSDWLPSCPHHFF